MARYLTAPNLTAVLNLGRQVEQLLSYRVEGDQRVIRWVSLWEAGNLVTVSLHEALDLTEEGFLDVTEFPSLDPCEDHGEGKWRSFDSREAAFAWIEGDLGGSMERFVNSGVIQDEVDDARSAMAVR